MKRIKQVVLGAVMGVMALLAFTGFKAQPVNAAESQPMSVISIDCGRKYFSLTQLKQIVARASQDGYTDVQLLLGNEGLRFILDDMSLTVNGQTYASAAVKDAVIAGDKAFYDDPNGTYLTQSEVDDLLAYADQLGIRIIPGINSPGHMDAVLSAMTTLGVKDASFSGSKSTIDLSNATAVAFAQAVARKYAAYFSKSCQIFDFGADEYASDVDKGSFDKLQATGDYSKFVTYVNQVAQIVKDAGMRPMTFNDGIYYHTKDTFGAFDKDILISYWTSGWIGYWPAKAAYLEEKGHEVLNTNDAWYWVIGNTDSGLYNYDKAMKNITSKKFDTVPGVYGATVVPTVGSMQAVWADDPAKNLDFEALLAMMDAFGNSYRASMPLPADYAQVDAAMAAVPANLTPYTAASVQALQAALAAVKRGLRLDAQATVDGYGQAITQAVAALAVKPADYRKLDAVIAQAEALKPGDYTDFSQVQTALADVKRDLPMTAQATVDQLTERLTAAIQGLKKITPKADPTPAKQPATPAKQPVTAAKQPAATAKHALPQTGNRAHAALAVAGLLVLLSFGGMLVKRSASL